MYCEFGAGGCRCNTHTLINEANPQTETCTDLQLVLKQITIICFLLCRPAVSSLNEFNYFVIPSSYLLLFSSLLIIHLHLKAAVTARVCGSTGHWAFFCGFLCDSERQNLCAVSVQVLLSEKKLPLHPLRICHAKLTCPCYEMLHVAGFSVENECDAVNVIHVITEPDSAADDES